MVERMPQSLGPSVEILKRKLGEFGKGPYTKRRIPSQSLPGRGRKAGVETSE